MKTLILTAAIVAGLGVQGASAFGAPFPVPPYLDFVLDAADGQSVTQSTIAPLTEPAN